MKTSMSSMVRVRIGPAFLILVACTSLVLLGGPSAVSAGIVLRFVDGLEKEIQ